LTHGILPAAGHATRLRGLPKFALPIDDGFRTLLEWHLEQMLETCDKVWIPIRPGTLGVVESLDLFSDSVIAVEVETQTMTESVLAVLEVSTADRFILGMPDSYFFQSENAYDRLRTTEPEVTVAVFPIRGNQIGRVGQVEIANREDGTELFDVLSIVDKTATCTFPYVWGAVGFGRELMDIANPTDPHIGYSMARWVSQNRLTSATVAGTAYYDCGTPEEYWSLLKRIHRN